MINAYKMSEKSLSPVPDDISVVDVYDLASDIGQECEKIIDCYGAEAVTALMPKVVNSLEWLESLASRNENENTTIQTLTDRVTYLQSEKLERAVYRERLQKELETLEEQWHNETKELREMVNKLQEENRRLKQSDTAKQLNNDWTTNNSPDTKPSTNLLNESDYQKLQRLRGQMEKQRDELMCRNQEIEEKNSEIENFTIQLERLRNTNRDSRKRQKLLQTQVRTLLDERSDLLLQIQDQTREINVLRRSIGFGDSEDLIKTAGACAAGTSQLSNNDLKQLLTEQDNLKAKIKGLESELREYKPAKVVETPTSLAEEMTPEKKMPEVEEEDPPVQGPLPYEPDDAPWKKTKENSGVRKFFRKLFTDQSTSSFPRRSLSTFSKMAISSSPSRNVAI